MSQDSSRIWRVLFVIAGVLYLAGGAQHPRGEMVTMLADPAWRPGHATSFAGLVALLAGLVLYRRARPASPSLGRWLGLALAATVLEVIEMAVHIVANVDANALAAGHATPVLTTHLWLATAIYPIFGIVMLGLIWVAQRERSLGSPWINWIGMVGAIAHGIVMPLVYLLGIPSAGILFPLAAVSLSLWFILAGVWPLHRVATPRAATGNKAPGTLVTR